MRAVIIGNGGMSNYNKIRDCLYEDDYIICADGGYRHAVRLGLRPDIIIGDMDSVHTDTGSLRAVRLPVKKDFTDGEAAVRYALEKGFFDIVLLGFTGVRMDHTLTNISLLKIISERHKRGRLIDEYNEISFAEERNVICGAVGDLVSIIPLSDELEGVTTEGLEYPLDDETLYFGESRGVSNVMLAETCVITKRSGSGLIIKSID